MNKVWATNKQRRIAIAEENFKSRAKRSSEEQIAVLDLKLGKGIGAKKERAKLLKQIETQS